MELERNERSLERSKIECGSCPVKQNCYGPGGVYHCMYYHPNLKGVIELGVSSNDGQRAKARV